MSGRGFRFLMLVVGLGTICSLAFIWELETTRLLAEEVEKLEREREEAFARLEQVRAEVSYLSRSERVTRIASERLGMTFPEELPALAYLWDEEGEPEGTDGSASPIKKLFGDGAFAEVRVKR